MAAAAEHPSQGHPGFHAQNGGVVERAPSLDEHRRIALAQMDGEHPDFEAQNGPGEGVERVPSLNERRRIALAEIDEAPFSRFHVKICLVAGIGFFTDAYDIFAISIAVEMLDIVYGPFGTWQAAGLKMATPIGNLIGQLLFGLLADIFGRKRMYGVELIIMIIATFGQAVSGAGPYFSIVGMLIVWRVIMGIGVGGDYPLSAIITSEFASTETRGRLMTAVFSFQGWGQLAASLVGLVVVTAFKDAINLSLDKVDYTWRLLIGLGCVPAAFVLYFRLTVPESPRFTIDIERKIAQAERDIENGLADGGYAIYDDDPINEARVIAPRASTDDFIAHFSRLENFKVLFATAYSWFALDISFYILALDYEPILSLIFTLNPLDPQTNPYQSLHNLCVASIVLAVAGLIPGFFVCFLLIDRWGRKPIQLMGFIILTILFWIMSFDYDKLVPGNASNPAFVVLYCLANFFQNFGPNTTTFIIPGEVFPTRYRSTAHGISAASGKLGAVIAQILFTIATQNGNSGVALVLKVLSFVMMTGVFSTLLIPETKQQTLENLSNEDQEGFIMEPLEP